jgi:acetyl esterase/lipase
MSKFFGLGLATSIVALCLVGYGQDAGVKKTATGPELQKQHDEKPYLSRRASFKTTLVKKGPAPAKGKEEPLPNGVVSVRYQSDGRSLKAWLFVPKLAENEKRPALVYLHGWFAFGVDNFATCKPFTDAGFVVLCPAYRGENGNPGDYQMFLGEADDAAAAVRWLASKKYVDRKKIYVFGHSAGGVVSSLLSLYDDLPVVHTGSAGGLYGADLFDVVSGLVPFDRTNVQERQMRLLVGNIRWMKRPHFAFTGRQDTLMQDGVATREAADAHAPLHVIEVPGDHGSSLNAAIHAYLVLVQAGK